MDKKIRMMNDMITIKKPVLQKQVLEDSEPVFDDQERPMRNRSGYLLWMIAIVCVGALVVGIGGLFTHAEILLTPKQVTGAVDTTVNLAQTHDGNTLFFGTATKTFTSENIVPSIGQAMNEVKATGTVKFYNTSATAKTIPAKTEIVSSTGKKYTVNKTITIPLKGLKNPGQIDAGVTAVLAGADGNSGLDDFTFSKPLKALAGVTIHSVSEITGGANGNDAVADPAMITSATERLRREFANSKALVTRLSEQVPDTMIALPVTLPEGPVMITLDPKHEDGVHVIASQKVSILMVNRVDIARAIGNSLREQKESNLTLKDFGNLLVMTNDLVAGQPIPQKLSIRITGNATVFGFLDTAMIKEKVLGLSRKELKGYLGQIPEVSAYKLHMRPFWRRVLPMDPGEVEVVD